MKKMMMLSAVALLAAGCSSVSKSDLDALNSKIDAAKASADKAYQAAQQANVNAQDAKAMSLKTDEKLNRMFRKAQMK